MATTAPNFAARAATRLNPLEGRSKFPSRRHRELREGGWASRLDAPLPKFVRFRAALGRFEFRPPLKGEGSVPAVGTLRGTEFEFGLCKSAR